MKIRVRKASSDNYESFVELKTIEDLFAFVENEGEIIVGDMFIPEKDEYELGITIHDDYVY
jgi:hypothetical protein